MQKDFDQWNELKKKIDSNIEIIEPDRFLIEEVRSSLRDFL